MHGGGIGGTQTGGTDMERLVETNRGEVVSAEARLWPSCHSLSCRSLHSTRRGTSSGIGERRRLSLVATAHFRCGQAAAR